MKSGLYYIEYIFEKEHYNEYVYVTDFGIVRLNAKSDYGDNFYTESIDEYVNFYDYSTYERVL
jgi:hypothetical protein